MAMKKPFSILIYGPAKTGKSTFANTAPGPKLIIDFESSAHWLVGRKIQWDPTNEPVPEYDGTWDIVFVSIQDYHDLDIIMDVLLSGAHPFRSVVVDSLSEGQNLIKDDRLGTTKMDLQKWGELAEMTGRFARDLRNLISRRGNPVENVIIIATETKIKDKEGNVTQIRPALKGKTQHELPYLYDVIGYYYISDDLVVDPEDNTKNHYEKSRYLFTDSSTIFTTGSRSPLLVGTYKNPTVTSMINTAYAVNEEETN